MMMSIKASVMSIKCVTGFWKTDRIVILGQFHYIGPALIPTRIHYPYTVALLALADWSAFLE